MLSASSVSITNARHGPTFTANPCLRREITEHVGRLLILSAHAHTPFTKRRGENTHERSFWLLIDYCSPASQEPKAQSLEPLHLQQPAGPSGLAQRASGFGEIDVDGDRLDGDRHDRSPLFAA
jgi:hypothetical protein